MEAPTAAPVAFISVTEGGFQRGEEEGGRRGRGQLESRGGTEAAVQGGSPASAALGTSYCNLREAEAVAFALELLIAGGDVEVRGRGKEGRGELLPSCHAWP